mgnify:CR=1 FL=1
MHLGQAFAHLKGNAVLGRIVAGNAQAELAREPAQQAPIAGPRHAMEVIDLLPQRIRQADQPMAPRNEFRVQMRTGIELDEGRRTGIVRASARSDHAQSRQPEAQGQRARQAWMAWKLDEIAMLDEAGPGCECLAHRRHRSRTSGIHMRSA